MEKKSSQIIRENITYMINNDETTSMRNLSTSIGASDSFIQKILTEKANPSLEKIDLISEYFDVESWEMLYNFRKDNNDMLSILQMLQKLPASSMLHFRYKSFRNVKMFISIPIMPSHH